MKKNVYSKTIISNTLILLTWIHIFLNFNLYVINKRVCFRLDKLRVKLKTKNKKNNNYNDHIFVNLSLNKFNISIFSWVLKSLFSKSTW